MPPPLHVSYLRSVYHQSTWEITPESETTIDAGDALTLQLRSIISSLPNGQTSLYVRYHNIPGYKDGIFSCSALKSPLVHRGANVGIGIVALS